MHEVTEGLLIAVLGAHLALLFFIAWQYARFSQCLRYYIRRLRWLVIGEMDCDELIDELMSVATARRWRWSSRGCSTGSRPGGRNSGDAGRAAGPGGRTGAKTPWKACGHRGGGQTRQYGLVVREKTFTANQIDALDSTEIEKCMPATNPG